MFKSLCELKHLKPSQLNNLSKLAHQFSRSLDRLAIEAQEREAAEKKKERVTLRKTELARLHKLKLQRMIMVRYLKGQSFEQIAAATGYHPKTIYKMIRRYEHDLSVLHKIDYDIEKQKIEDAEKLIRLGAPKKEIIKKLNISAHSVVAVAYMKNLNILN